MKLCCIGIMWTNSQEKLYEMNSEDLRHIQSLTKKMRFNVARGVQENITPVYILSVIPHYTTIFLIYSTEALRDNIYEG